jgi:carbon-monoxide dehydrogenase iron sulfur subunit
VPKRLSVMDVDSCVGCQCCMFACARRLGQGGLQDAVIGIRSAGGVRRGFLVVVCRACPSPPCARVCPTDSLVARPGGGVHLQPDLCIGCGNCVEACPFRAIFWDAQQNKPRVCVYCGYCARYCPYDVLALEDVVAPPALDSGAPESPPLGSPVAVPFPEVADAQR